MKNSGLFCYLDTDKKVLEKTFNSSSNSDELIVDKTTYHFDDNMCIVIQTTDKSLINSSISKNFKKYKFGFKSYDKSGIFYYCVKIDDSYYLWHSGDLNTKFIFLKRYEN